jgi:hypothetical protein
MVANVPIYVIAPKTIPQMRLVIQYFLVIPVSDSGRFLARLLKAIGNTTPRSRSPVGPYNMKFAATFSVVIIWKAV